MRFREKISPIHLTQGPAINVGPALIDAGDDPGIIIENAEDVTIKDIIICGNGRTHNQNGGIRIENSTDRTLSNVFIDNVGGKSSGRRTAALLLTNATAQLGPAPAAFSGNGAARRRAAPMAARYRRRSRSRA